MKKSYPPINALLRGLDVLAHVSALGTASIRELHARTSISKPTIVRNLETLEHAGYVTRNPDTGLYSLTARVLGLSAGYNHHNRLVELATPVLDAFRKVMPWPSDLALFDRDAMVIIQSNRDPGALALNRTVGTRLSITKSALGRAYLAFCDPKLKDIVLDRCLDPHSDGVAARNTLEQELARYRVQGFSENDQSLSKDTRGVGVPILVNGKIEACINTIVLVEALSMKDVIRRCVPLLIETAEKISDALQEDAGA